MIGGINIKKKVYKWFLIFCLIFFGFFSFNLYRSYHCIQVSSYGITDDKISKPLRIVMISDQHSSVFGKENSELIEKIILYQPDAIFMVGDMINQDSASPTMVLELIKQLIAVAPVYYAMGNHELAWMDHNNEDLYQELKEAGAVVLEQNWVDVEIKGQLLRIGGLYEYAFYLGDLEDLSNPKLDIYNFLTEFQDTDSFKIMLSHRPDSFIFADAAKNWDIDLVVSGHLHGGQVVLPGLGGIYGGDQGWLPDYVHGLYEKEKIKILITSGLGTNKKAVPRWNNPPEIMILELMNQK